MRLTRLNKGVVATATALCLFLALAAPASANPYPLTVTGGTLTVAGNTFNLGPGAPGPCPAKPSTLQALLIPDNPSPPAPPGTSPTGLIQVTGGWSSQFQLGTPPSGQWYQADFTILPAPPAPPPAPQLRYGPLTVAGPPIWTYPIVTVNPIIFQARVYRIPSCDKTDLACIITVRMTFTGTINSATPLMPYTPGWVTLNGTSVAPHIVVASCSAPFVAWAGQTATIAGLTLV
jgi:hypothetical protein